MNKLIYGLAINDANYTVKPKINGKRYCCKFYQTWKNMLDRCYMKSFHQSQPKYAGCTVCDEWLIFSNFKRWMEAQDWEGKQLDKDIIIVGNKIYSPDTCAFVSQATNVFVEDRLASRGNFPIGACFSKKAKKFIGVCGNPITGAQEHLGLFVSPNMAHQAWRKRKHEISCQLADLQTDERVAVALRLRYA